MNTHTTMKLVMFNLLFVILEIILFSPGLVHIGKNTVAALLTGLVSLAVFIGVNYWILSSRGKRKALPLDKLKTVPDYREALEDWNGRRNPFHKDVQEAIHALDLFTQKESALKALLGQEAQKGNPFLAVSEDVQDCLLSNMRRILTRMTIADPSDAAQMPVHEAFMQQIQAQNREILSQYDNLIIEISQIGDSRNLNQLNLEAITENLRELRSQSADVTLSDF